MCMLLSPQKICALCPINEKKLLADFAWYAIQTDG